MNYLTTYGYDAQNNLLTVTQGAQPPRNFTYDGVSRLTTAKNPESDTVCYGSRSTLTSPCQAQYDGLGNLTDVYQNATVNAQGAVTGYGQTRHFGYSSLSRLTSSANPESGSVSYTYYPNGTAKTKGDQRNTATYTYDALGRMTSKTYSGLDATPAVTYCYDGSFFQIPNGCVPVAAANAIGRLTSISNLATVAGGPVGTTMNYLSFDAEGRVLSSGQQTDSTVWPAFQYQYTPGGQLKKIQYPSGHLVSFGFDTMGRTNALAKGGAVPAAGAASAANSYLWNATYLANGQMQGFQYGTGSPRYSNRAYNFRGQPTAMQVGSSAGTGDVWQLENDYGSDSANSGNVLWQYLTPSAGLLVSTGYHYDGFNRLDLAAEKPGTAKNGFTPGCPDAGAVWCFQYGYDVYGNRSIAQRAGSGSGVALNEPGGYTAATNRIAGGTWAYDELGNIKQDGSGAGMAWDAENRMVDYCAGVGTGCGDTTAGAVRYAYDGDGHRTKTVIGGLTTTYVYDAFDNLAAEYGAQGATTGLQFSVQDHLGTTRAVMDASGAVLERVDYHPFGAEIPAESGSWRTQIAGYGLSTPTTRLRFTGKERDAESGNDYFGARYYASSMGRFMSPDPKQPSMKHLMNPQKWNKYAYVLNNPLSLVDPDGLEEITVQLRAYIPQASVGPYRGDNRGPTASQSVTSRTSITMRIETDPRISANPLLSNSGGQAGVTHNDLTGNSATQTQGLPNAQVSRDANGNVVINIKQDAPNPLTPQGMTPGIKSDLTVNVRVNGTSVTTSGTVSGSPAFELNVGTPGNDTTNIPLQGASGNSVMFGIGLTQTNTIQNTKPLPPPRCTSGQSGCSQ